MSKKRGLSLEDKRDVILNIFHESADVFQFKDVEKIASKRGVVQQSIKDVLQSLVDDGLVHCEKIGISNFYWSFPAEASVKLANDARAAEEQLAAVKKRRTDALAKVQQAKQGKEDSAERSELAARRRVLQQRLSELTAEAQARADSDPEALAAMKQAAEATVAAANRWTDNLLALQSWCKRRFEGREAEVDTFFTDNGWSDFEYLPAL